MQYASIKNIDIPVSRLIFGCALPAMLKGANVDAVLDEAFCCGFTAFDTAEVYGKSEEVLGDWLTRRGLRDKTVLITKGAHPRGPLDRVTPQALREDFEQSLHRLQTDYIDIYLLHRDDFRVPVEPLVDVLNEFVAEGKLRAFGGSNWTCDRLSAANDYAKKNGLIPFSVSSPNFGLCVQKEDPFGGSAGCVSISGPAGEASRRWYRENDIPVLAYSSLGGGMLSGKVKSDDPEGAKQVLNIFAQKGYLCEENLGKR